MAKKNKTSSKRYPSQSSSMERRVQSYFKPRIYKLFESERHLMERSASEHNAMLAEKHYASYAPADIRMLLDHYEKIKTA